MSYTTEEIALQFLSSMLVGYTTANGSISSTTLDRTITRAFTAAEMFIAERDRRRAEVEKLADEVRDHD